MYAGGFAITVAHFRAAHARFQPRSSGPPLPGLFFFPFQHWRFAYLNPPRNRRGHCPGLFFPLLDILWFVERAKHAKTLNERVAATGQLLMRSGIEIGRLLQGICNSGVPLSASLDSGELLFLSRLVAVDHEAGFILIACSDVKHANSALLDAPTVVFGCTYEGVRYEFASGKAAEALHNGAPAIRLVFPPAVLALQRRARPRTAIPPRTTISCIAQVGPLRFEAQLADITPEGLGAIVYDPTIRIEPGTRLNAVEVAFGPNLIKLDLELRHFSRVVLPSGASAVRAGCRVIGPGGQIERLVRHFLKELDPDPS